MSILISDSCVVESLIDSGGFLSLIRSSTRLFGDTGRGNTCCFGDNGGTVGEQRSIIDDLSFGCGVGTGTVGKAVLIFKLTGTSFGGSDESNGFRVGGVVV